MTTPIKISDEMLDAAGRAFATAYGGDYDGPLREDFRHFARSVIEAAAPLIAAQVLQPVERGVQDALDWVTREYRQCIVSARCTHDSGHYERVNGRAEAYRQLGTLVATGARLPVPDWEGIKREVPADGIYRTAPGRSLTEDAP